MTDWNWNNKEAEFNERVRCLLQSIGSATFQALESLVVGKNVGRKPRHFSPEGMDLEMDVLRQLGYVRRIEGNRDLGVTINSVFWSTLNDYQLTPEGREIYDAIVNEIMRER